MSMLPRRGKCAMCGYDWDQAASDCGPVLKIFNKAASFCGLPGQGVVWDVPHETEVQDIPQGVTVQRRRPEGEVAEMVNGFIGCLDCGTPHPFPLDTTLPHEQWRAIAPTDGLLCANCMVARAAKLPGVIAARMTIEFA